MSTQLSSQIMESVAPLNTTVCGQAAETRLLEGGGELVFGGVDGGSSGAMAFVDPAGRWEVQPVFTAQERGHWLLQIHTNLDFITTVAKRAGGAEQPGGCLRGSPQESPLWNEE